MKEMGANVAKTERVLITTAPSMFKAELLPKPRGAEVNIHVPVSDHVDSGPGTANDLLHDHFRQVVRPPSAFSFLLWDLKQSVQLISTSLPALQLGSQNELEETGQH